MFVSHDISVSTGKVTGVRRWAGWQSWVAKVLHAGQSHSRFLGMHQGVGEDGKPTMA